MSTQVSTGPWSYEHASGRLHQILRDPIFQPPQAKRPWWQMLFQWLKDHMHISLSHGEGRLIAYLLLALVAVGLIWVVLRMIQAAKSGTRRIRYFRQESPAEPDLLGQAEMRLEAGEYTLMVQALLESCLRYAQDAKWIRCASYKTSRMYARELREKSNPQFYQLFIELAGASEMARFARRELSPTVAGQLLHTVRAVLSQPPEVQP